MPLIYLLPLWIRIWHWTNALLFLILIFTGISIHYSDTGSLLIPFSTAIALHNVAGILLLFLYLFYVLMSLIKGNYKHYIPGIKTFFHDITEMMKYYLLGIFYKERKPFKLTKENKFNPMQKISYLGVMIFLMPTIIISGILLLFPETAPDEILGMGGVWPMAMLHTITGYLLSVFMFVHIYLATTGHTALELYRSMITGWHHIEDESHDETEIQQKETKKKTREKGHLFPSVFYNPLTYAGFLVAIISLVFIVFLTAIELFSENPNPYVGIITFIALPSVMIFGIFLIFFGIIRENRRIIRKETKGKSLPVIDLNNPKHQIATMVFSIGGLLLIMFSVFGSFKAYEYTESDEFCGTLCHEVMKPEYVSYMRSPHSKVGCVKCHIGSGADWFVKSKLSGSYQVYAVLADVFPRPIPTPIDNLRPAQETCEQCHWPKHFYDEKKIVRDYYLSDE